MFTDDHWNPNSAEQDQLEVVIGSTSGESPSLHVIVDVNCYSFNAIRPSRMRTKGARQ